MTEKVFYISRDTKEWFGHRVEIYRKKPKLVNGQWSLGGDRVAMFCVGRFESITGIELEYGTVKKCKIVFMEDENERS